MPLRRRLSPTGWALSWLASFLPLLAACSSTLEPLADGDAFVQTDAHAYTLTESGIGLAVDVPYTFTNSTSSAVYFVNCGGGFGFWLERETDGGWQIAWTPALLSCLSPPIVVEAGERLEGTFRIIGAAPGTNARPQFDRADPTGTYRIVVDALSSYQDRVAPFGKPLPLEYRVSNRFTLRK